jgi:multicomponent Na+:H+ antiporter subunit D
LAGAPPLSGFFAKLSLLQGAALKGRWEMVAIMLAVGVVTLMSMIKIWSEAYAKPLPEGSRLEGASKAKWMLPAGVLAAIVILMGLGAGPVQDVLMRAGAELSSPDQYQRLVLGGNEP